MRLFLVRHGQTSANESGVFYGRTDLPLTEKGIAQSTHVGRCLADVTFITLFTSQLQRAQQTAKLIVPKGDFQVDSRLNELDFGTWEMCHYSAIAQNEPVAWQNWLDDWQNATPGGGEPFPAFARRVKEVAEAWKANPGEGDRLVVAHQGVLSMLLASWLNMPLESMWHFPFKHDAWTLVENRGGFMVLRSFNDRSRFLTDK